MIGRVAISVGLGTAVTIVVLFTMQALIATAKKELDESGTRHFVDFVRVEPIARGAVKCTQCR